MKQQENGKIPVTDTELPELDLELAEMADEVPPMPADFHARWMQAVREEAGKRQEPETGKPAGKAVAFTRGPWFRALSVAAVFVFLIGGTVLYRSGKKTIAPVYQAGTLAVTGAPEIMAAGETEADAARAPEQEAGTDAETDSAGEAGGIKAAGLTFSAEDKDVAFEAIGGSTVETAGEMEEAAEAPAPVNAAASEPRAAEAPAEALEEAPAKAPAEASEEAPAETPKEVPADAPAAEPAPTFLQQAGSFLSDMGAFLLSVWPWLAGAAVILAAWIFAAKRKTGK